MHSEVERLHEPKTYSWLQREVHVYDPDGHLIEVGESMYSVGCKQFDEGKSIEQTAQLTQFPINEVEKWYRQYSDNR